MITSKLKCTSPWEVAPPPGKLSPPGELSGGVWEVLSGRIRPPFSPLDSPLGSCQGGMGSCQLSNFVLREPKKKLKKVPLTPLSSSKEIKQTKEKKVFSFEKRTDLRKEKDKTHPNFFINKPACFLNHLPSPKWGPTPPPWPPYFIEVVLR